MQGHSFPFTVTFWLLYDNFSITKFSYKVLLAIPSGNYQSLENISNYKLKALTLESVSAWALRSPELTPQCHCNCFKQSEDLQSYYIIKLKAFNCTHLSTHFSSFDIFWSIQTLQRDHWLLETCHLYILKLPSSDLRPAIQYTLYISTPKPAPLHVILELLNVQIFNNSKKSQSRGWDWTSKETRYEENIRIKGRIYYPIKKSSICIISCKKSY